MKTVKHYPLSVSVTALCSISLLLLLCTAPLDTMGKEHEDSSAHGPRYIELHPDQGIYSGTLRNGEKSLSVTRISFAGDTVLEGVRNETDDSHSRIKLSDISALTIVDPFHKSTRYPEQEYARVTLTTRHGVVVENTLFPRHLIICAQDQVSQIEYAWFLRSISRLEIAHGDAIAPIHKKAPTTAPLNAHVNAQAHETADSQADALALLDELLCEK